MTAGTAAPLLKPRMRGWLHFWSFVVSIVVRRRARGGRAARVGAGAALATAVYSVTILGLFGVSALYHRHTWRTPRARAIMKRLDHSMIFLFIAGTYTPVAALAHGPGHGPLGAHRGVGRGARGRRAQDGVAARAVVAAVPVYMALGWVAVFVLPELLQNGGVAAFVLLLAGGALYTAGAVFYATKWPNPWPRTFGYHEFFHAATVLAALCHLVAIWLVLLR